MANWQYFLPLIPILSLRWQVFAIDFRGHGESSHTEGPYTVRQLADDIASFVGAQIDQPPVIYGYSMGGVVGILMASEKPDVFRALIVGDAPLYRDAVEAIHERHAPKLAKRQALLRSEPTADGLSNKIIEAFPHFDGALSRYSAKTLTQLDPGILELLTNFDKEYDCTTLLPRIGCPVLLLQSEVMTEEHVRRAMKDLPDGYVVNMEGDHRSHAGPHGYEAIAAVSLFLEGV